MISFEVFGLPKSKGSFRPFVNRKTGQALMVRGKSSVQWETLVRSEAQRARTSLCPLDGPLTCTLVFSLQAPKTVKRQHPTTRPDLDKLVRGVFDGMTGILYKDDCQIVALHCSKKYGVPGVTISLDSYAHA